MTDEQIVVLYWRRDEQAIAETEKEYGRYLRTIAARILEDDGACEEVVNDTYAKAWATIPPNRPTSLKNYLGCMVRQLSINRLKESTRQKRGGGQYPLALEELSACIPANSGEDLAELTVLRDALNQFLRQLSDEKRRIFIRRYWYMDSVSEVARRFHISESKVKSMLLRTREKLREYLRKEGFFV